MREKMGNGNVPSLEKMLKGMLDMRAHPSLPSSQVLLALVALLMFGMTSYSPVSAENSRLHEFDDNIDDESGYQTIGKQSNVFASISFAGSGEGGSALQLSSHFVAAV
jgi:hypothetical protein